MLVCVNTINVHYIVTFFFFFLSNQNLSWVSDNAKKERKKYSNMSKGPFTVTPMTNYSDKNIIGLRIFKKSF